MRLFLITCLLLSASAIASAQSKPSADPSPSAALLDAATRVAGSGAKIIRFGHLSAPDLEEAVVAVVSSTSSRDGLLVTKLVVLRQVGSSWSPDLTVDKVIRNPQGFLGATALDQLRRSDLYKVELFNHLFDDGKNRFVIQLTPVTAEGRPSAPSIYVSWNFVIARYQQISLQGYGFEPELHEPLPANAQ
jgi:hypothetical protein